MGYKGSSGKITDSQREEYHALTDIICNAKEDLVGSALLERHLYLSKLYSGADAGYFYAPYIPLIISDGNNGIKWDLSV